MPRWLPRALLRIRACAESRKVLFTLKARRELVLYPKVVLRVDSVVISFHEDEGGHEEDR